MTNMENRPCGEPQGRGANLDGKTIEHSDKSKIESFGQETKEVQQ